MDNWLNEIKEERARQVEKWGEQNHHLLAATCVAMLESIERKQKQGKLPCNERNGGVLF